MTTDINQRLSEIKERAERATKDPWARFAVRKKIGGAHFIAVGPENLPIILVPTGTLAESQHEALIDATFIANARSDVPFLLAEIDRLQGERLELIKVGFTSCIDMGPPSKVKSNDGTHTTTWTWEEPDYEAVLATYLQSRQERGKDE